MGQRTRQKTNLGLRQSEKAITLTNKAPLTKFTTGRMRANISVKRFKHRLKEIISTEMKRGKIFLQMAEGMKTLRKMREPNKNSKATKRRKSRQRRTQSRKKLPRLFKFVKKTTPFLETQSFQQTMLLCTKTQRTLLTMPRTCPWLSGGDLMK